MEYSDLKKYKKIYFIGIGGISMSSLAVFLQQDGFLVCGSDATKSTITMELEELGISINYCHKKDNIDQSIDIIVYSSAIHSDNEEMIKAKELGIKVIKRSVLLGLIMSNYKYRINIAGTHGKSTTTSMISKIFIDSKKMPTITIGAVSKDFNNHYIIGNKDYFIAEACEYTNSFLDFCPNVCVITNICEDHLDFFKDLNDIRNSFRLFIEKMNDDGLLVINSNIPNIDELIKNYNGRIITYGINTGNYFARNIRYDNGYKYDLWNNNKYFGEVELNIMGRHNVENSIAAFALALNMNLDFNTIKNSLKNFIGTERRLENIGIFNGITIIDDYAHHPEEIKASLNAIYELNKNNYYLIYQPHTYSRTKKLLDEFIDVFKNVNNLILVPIYPAREINIYNIESNNLVDLLNEKYRINAKYLETFEKATEYVVNQAKSGDVIIIMGAGNISKIKSMILNKYL